MLSSTWKRRRALRRRERGSLPAQAGKLATARPPALHPDQPPLTSFSSTEYCISNILKTSRSTTPCRKRECEVAQVQTSRDDAYS
eukprot:CAMPEP_0198196694 /NCGR_PEP_ID=MMETSP1445-20131203/32_1 /TAXON_ID=36898 /ORGANISM="Pyramimonas sp., Strain CCMP2087" /LENGTH=84 /DNA_ID=CAMNT_0043865605 /DNA_START=176 /DNA_END=431 /DNA_ORIENTATION=-